MTHLSDLFDLSDLRAEIAGGYVSAKRHPTLPLTIYNYGHSVQWERRWNPVTLACRGLIADDDGLVVARGLPKFFNVEEHDDPATGLPPLPYGAPFEVYEKVDGSLLIAAQYRGELVLATRGSFMSDQAKWAARHWLDRYAHHLPPEGQTWLLEILYPGNRIVVSYGDREDLVFLACLDTDSGCDLPIPDDWDGPRAKRYHVDDLDMDVLRGLVDDDGDSEGFVVRFVLGDDRPSVRTKVKLAEYVRLHRILTGLTSRDVYERVAVQHMRDEGFTAKQAAYAALMDPAEAASLMELPDTLAPLLERVPDEFYDWIRRLTDDLYSRYAEVEAEARALFESYDGDPAADRKRFALWAKEHGKSTASILFNMADGRPYGSVIWRMLRPEGGETFVQDDEG